MEPQIPEAIRRLTAGKPYHADEIGMSGSQILLFDDMVLKIVKDREKNEETLPLLLALRTRDGLDLEALRAQYGERRVQEIVHHFREHVPARQYENTAGKLRLTAEGLWFADGIAEKLFNVD